MTLISYNLTSQNVSINIKVTVRDTLIYLGVVFDTNTKIHVTRGTVRESEKMVAALSHVKFGRR